MVDKILEEDLCGPISEHFTKAGYTVRSEVNFCDITAIKEDILVVIELKKNLSVELLAQAVKRQKAADLVYIAVPKPRRMLGTSKWRDICHLLRRLELGLILVSFKGDKSFIEIPVEPIPFDREKSRTMNKRKRESIIKEASGRYNDSNVGGSRGRKLVTTYRESAIFVACALRSLGPLTPKMLRSVGTDEKKTTAILSENHYGWFERIERGIYGITERGKKALEEYPELVKYYSGKINSKEE
jgi:hypothetical protein